MKLVLEQKQIQTQKLSPQMIQSMELLQMSTLELHEYVEEQLLENPILEREDVYDQEEGTLLLRKLEWLIANNNRGRLSKEENTGNLAETIADTFDECLYDHLSAQVPWKSLSAAMRRGVDCVLTGLDDNGWLDETAEELAWRGGVSVDIILNAELLVQGLDPAGVGAHTLAQCLELQLNRLGENGLPVTIVREHLEEMAKDHYNQIARTLGVSREAVQQACLKIRSLNPRPGSAFARAVFPAHIAPDVQVSEEEGKLVVLLTGQGMPELKISDYYCDLLRNSEEEQVKEYLTQKIQQADWLLKSIEQRKNTMIRCMQCIVEWQEAFFRRGRHFLRPMTLADVAAKAEIHESTVSRAVRNKYVQCTWGLFPLSDLFSRAVACGEEDLAAVQVKAHLRTLIEQEDKRKPLSDQKLCDTLAEQGITVARRTVAKYRDEMGYPSAPGRRKFDSLAN